MLKNSSQKQPPKEIEIAGISFSLSQKRIRNLHLRICPPFGEVKVSAPLRFSLAQIKNFVIQKIDWIKEKQIEIRSRKFVSPAPPLKFLSGENHFIFGQKFELKLVEESSKNKVVINKNFIELHIKNSDKKFGRKIANAAAREKILDNFYRAELKKIIPEFIEKYEQKMQVKVAEFGVKKMTTRWGTCNPKDRRIWLSLALAKKPLGCLEMIITHEMTHLLERRHNKNFYGLMTKFMPDWKIWDGELKSSGRENPVID